MKKSVTPVKETNAKKAFSSTKSDKSIHRVQHEPERQLGSLRGVINNIIRNGSTPSVDSIATQLSSMHSTQRAPMLLTLQRTYGNRYVQRVVAGIQAKLAVGQIGDKYEQEADKVFHSMSGGGGSRRAYSNQTNYRAVSLDLSKYRLRKRIIKI